MSRLAVLAIGLFIGVCVGLWFGVNIEKGVPILTSPFEGSILSSQ